MSKREMHQKLFEEFDYKEKAGTAWSHNYLNQKPWHPLSYPNQRRKWIAEQMHGIQDKRLTEIEKEFQKEQEYFKQTALLSKKQKAKAEAMQSVSFLYMKPPGYNAESARAAELAEEERVKQEREKQMMLEGQGDDGGGEGGGGSAGGGGEGGNGEGEGGEGGGMARDGALVLADAGETAGGDKDKEKKKKKPRATDVFGRAVPTGDDFEVLKNAPRMDTGIIGRPRPFGLELRNVKCGRCGAIGHSSGERECPLFNSVTENDLKRQQREDPLSHILALNRPQPFGWELKEQGAGGMSPARGGFKPNDANQQILPPSDDENEGVFDQYGGFLLGGEEGVAVGAAGFAAVGGVGGVGGIGGVGGVGGLLPGIPSSVLDSLTKQQRKDLSRALRKKEEEERKKRRKKKKKTRAGGESKKGREKGSKKDKKGHRRRHHHHKDSDSSSDLDQILQNLNQMPIRAQRVGEVPALVTVVGVSAAAVTAAAVTVGRESVEAGRRVSGHMRGRGGRSRG
ncbi:hypothetical protein CLOM_g11793 [Closterium sp. NIES-68]|nr:hypothetical protein CLOM_g11793 [Closterium sp. NIES-68]